jgi:hypothetical protein
MLIGMKIVILAFLFLITTEGQAQRGRRASQLTPILTALARSGVQDNVMLSMPAYSNTTIPEAAIRDIRAIADAEMATMRRTRRVFTVGQDRVREHCATNCACLARDIIPLLRARGYTTRRFSVIRGLRMVTPSMQSVYYDFHVVTVVHLSNQWWVLDPVVLRGTRLERLDTWLERVIPETLTVGRVF